MNKTSSFNKIFGNDRVVVVFSIAAALISWIVVAMTTADTIPKTIHNVPVNLDVKADNLADVGLSIVPIGETLVNVHVNGQRTVVGNLTPEDLFITVRVSGITEANTYDLVLVSEGQTEGYDITSIEPSTIRVRLDQIDSEEFTVELEQRGISFPPDHMLDTPTVRPSTITVTGPRSELERIEKVQAVVELEEALYGTYTTNVPVRLLDASGTEIIPAESSLSLNYDDVSVVIPVLKIKTLPLVIDYTNQPDDFPLDDLLRYAMVTPSDYIKVAGPVSLIENTTEIKVGAISLRDITPQNNVFSFDVSLPSDQYENLDNTRTVTVTFASDYWEMATFTVDNIRETNKPAGFAVELLTRSLQVTIVAPDDIMESLTADDIVAEVRYSDREIVDGQYKYPIRLSVPTKGLAWAVGEYSVVIQAEQLNVN